MNTTIDNTRYTYQFVADLLLPAFQELDCFANSEVKVCYKLFSNNRLFLAFGNGKDEIRLIPKIYKDSANGDFLYIRNLAFDAKRHTKRDLEFFEIFNTALYSIKRLNRLHRIDGILS